MRTKQLLSSLIFSISSISVCATPQPNTCPFSRALIARDLTNETIDKRQTTNPCGPNLQSCSFLSRPGAGSACCATDAICTLDNAGNVACCPEGAFCTGTLTSVPATISISTSTTTGGTVIVPGATISGPAPSYAPGQYISNAYFPFPVLWLAGAQFPDANQCAAAYQTCESYYTSCTNALQSGQQVPAGYGVTVSAPGGGFTAQAGNGGVTVAPVGQASATSICGSLRNVGCPGQGATCGGAQPTPTPTQTDFVVIPPSNDGSRTLGGGSVAGLVAILAWTVIVW